MKLLVVIGGICSKPYAMRDLQKSCFPVSSYDKIIEFNYEQFLDEKLDWLPFYDKFKLFDKHGDWLQFALCENLRKKIREELAWEINMYDPDTIDVIAHSLGAWIVLGACGVDWNNAWLAGCPLGAKSWIMRQRVKKEIEAGLCFLHAKKVYYLWNSRDFVAGSSPQKLLWGKASNWEFLNIGNSHDLLDYLDSYTRRKYINA